MEKDMTWDPRKVSEFKVKDMIICLSISDRGDDMQEKGRFIHCDRRE